MCVRAEWQSVTRWHLPFKVLIKKVKFSPLLLSFLWINSYFQSPWCARLGEYQGDWSRIRQSWQTYKGGAMDQEYRKHESRWGELPTEPRMGQAFTYKQKSVKVCILRREWVTLTANFRHKRPRPPTTVGVGKLEWLPFRVVSKYPQCMVWFYHKACVCQTVFAVNFCPNAYNVCYFLLMP